MDCKISCETWLVILGTLLSVLLRCCTTLHPYSGEASPPMYGDYEAQRHWMEITVNLPIDQWYRNGSDNDLNYWGLDYPPLTAYHMYLCGRVAQFLNENYTKLHDSRGYESESHKVFMRTTVLLGDIFIFIPAIILYYHTCIRLGRVQEGEIKKRKQKPSRTLNEIKPMSPSLSTVLALLYPGIILIDHGHFQYNCVSLGLAILATVCLLHDRNISASVLFCLALNYKQMELYHALPFFLYLLSTCVPKPGQSALWGVLRLTKNRLYGSRGVLHRQFPVARGVFEDKVANVWCALNVVFKFKTRFDNYQMMRICLFATLSALFPSSVDLFLRPNLRKFVLALINSSLAFFLFSFQVHEKSILLVAIPVLLYFPYAPFVCFWFLCVSVFSMTPLLFKDQLAVAVIALSAFYVVSFRVSIEHAYRSSLNAQEGLREYYRSLFHTLLDIEYNKDIVKMTYRQLVKNYDALRTLLFHSVMFVSLLGCVVLGVLALALEPPARYPDLYPLIRIPQQFEDVRNIKEVVDESDGCGGKFSCVIVSEKFKGETVAAEAQAGQFRAARGAEVDPRLLAEDFHSGAVGRAETRWITRASPAVCPATSREQETANARRVEVNVSAPGKVILHGEHSVVYGKLALAASLGLRTKFRIAEISAPYLVVVNLPVLDTVFTYDLRKIKQHLIDPPLPLARQPSEFNWELPEFVHHAALVDKTDAFMAYSVGANNLNVAQQTALRSMFYLIAGILGSVNVELGSVLLESRTELTVGAGTGSSASYLVTVAAALVQYVKVKRGDGACNVSRYGFKPCYWDVNAEYFDEKELEMICKWALCAERIVHGTPSGVDNTICTYGFMVEFRKGLAPKLLEGMCPLRILLINTHVPRETKKQVSKVARLHEQYPDLVENVLRAMEDVAFTALQRVAALNAALRARGDAPPDTARYYDELGRLMTVNHHLLGALEVSHVRLDEAVLLLAMRGLHGKMTGAGGGGYAIGLVPPHMDARVVQDVAAELAARGFSVAITELGGPGLMLD
ncbi:hypothetical protein NQ318_015028 [Aromia moschata]|uniref:dolichyl-P-Glc:Man9GlcNAc2-PP-dolichol alpha-1,3-glucosyltransferase n=1 Tax=Aromia moschata TaxID=1265417 RepID=A0AAV8YXM2_9CUCU|nr:hypothetical protein NQ318_015028 [Aromia moschata]